MNSNYKEMETILEIIKRNTDYMVNLESKKNWERTSRNWASFEKISRDLDLCIQHTDMLKMLATAYTLNDSEKIQSAKENLNSFVKVRSM